MKETTRRRQSPTSFLCKHLVCLSVTYRHTSDSVSEPARFAACAGTLILIHGIVSFLTAGHVLKALDELRQSKGVDIENAWLVDTLGEQSISDLPIPIDLRAARFFYVDDNMEGLDFGVMAIHPHHVRLLALNGVEVLSEQRWVHQSRVRFDKYLMLGLPEELTTGHVSAAGEASIVPVLLDVRKLDRPPDERAPTRHPQFIGKIDPSLPLKSMKGMSGGPIFGFRKESDTSGRYWIVALQSSWNREKSIVYGCPLPILASLMTAWGSESSPAA